MQSSVLIVPAGLVPRSFPKGNQSGACSLIDTFHEFVDIVLYIVKKMIGIVDLLRV